jgi:hypothetical protein
VAYTPQYSLLSPQNVVSLILLPFSLLSLSCRDWIPSDSVFGQAQINWCLVWFVQRSCIIWYCASKSEVACHTVLTKHYVRHSIHPAGKCCYLCVTRRVNNHIIVHVSSHQPKLRLTELHRLWLLRHRKMTDRETNMTQTELTDSEVTAKKSLTEYVWNRHIVKITERLRREAL